MCGILCCVWRNCENQEEVMADYTRSKCMIENRGPDNFSETIIDNLDCNWKAKFAASVLWMQGSRPVPQPCVDSDGNVLLWNGDIFSGCLAREDVSDTQTLLKILQETKNVEETFENICGPYSVVYYQATRGLIYFARDPIGRHSLLIKIDKNCRTIIITSSSCTDCKNFVELPAVGIFVFNPKNSELQVYPWRGSEKRLTNFSEHLKDLTGVELVVLDAIGPVKKESTFIEPESKDIFYSDEILKSNFQNEKFEMRPEIVDTVMRSLASKPEVRMRVQTILELLRKSIETRVKKKPNYCKNCVKLIINNSGKIVCEHSKLGILFSGGLDSTILATLADEFVLRDDPIDLVNVAFEKIRNSHHKANVKSAKNLNDVAINFEVPDRKTGRKALAELKKLCPWRTWNFIECNVTQEELKNYRSTKIRDLVYPLSTILDDSLGCALWFASRGSGLSSLSEQLYVSPTRVLLLGMGADELFGGYTRHRTTLKRQDWSALGAELDLELSRISERNLGRDDRVVSDHGKQSRLPYLDENFVNYVNSLKPWERCYPTEEFPPGLGDKLLLRLVAYEIGLRETANFPKRAFQFGSRIANSKENARDVSKWV